MFQPCLDQWQLQRDGEPIRTAAGHLLPVRAAGRPAMVKISVTEEERRGARQLVWWDGRGAVRVLAHADPALLMDRADDPARLTQLALNGGDDDASRILCQVAADLHAPRSAPLPDLEPLDVRFRSLPAAAARYGGIFDDAWRLAQALLDAPERTVALHGDLHHGNVLHFAGRGWCAIDPKGVLGERSFEFVNILTNPTVEVALAPGRLARQVQLISDAAQLDAHRFTQWIVAWGGLSAAWHLEEGNESAAQLPLAVARLAWAALR